MMANITCTTSCATSRSWKRTECGVAAGTAHVREALMARLAQVRRMAAHYRVHATALAEACLVGIGRQARQLAKHQPQLSAGLQVACSHGRGRCPALGCCACASAERCDCRQRSRRSQRFTLCRLPGYMICARFQRALASDVLDLRGFYDLFELPESTG